MRARAYASERDHRSAACCNVFKVYDTKTIWDHDVGNCEGPYSKPLQQKSREDLGTKRWVASPLRLIAGHIQGGCNPERLLFRRLT